LSFSGDLYPSVASKVMTTKGDMVDYDTIRQRLGIGSTGQVLTVASSLPTWATLTTADSVLTTQGDVLYESASGLARLGFGTTGDVLTTKGTGANPVWETPSAGSPTLSGYNVELASPFTTTSSSYVEVTGMTVDKPTISGGQCLSIFYALVQNNDNGHLYSMYEDDTTDVAYGNGEGHVDEAHTLCCGDQSSADGQTYSLNTRASAGTEIIQTGGDGISVMTGLGIG